MVNFTVDQVRGLMDNKYNIRNMSVIAHVDHGKSTLSDSLVAKAGIIASHKAGDMRFMDSREDEQARGITIKSTAVSLYYTMDRLDELSEEERKAEDERRKVEESLEKQWAEEYQALISEGGNSELAELGIEDESEEMAGDDAPIEQSADVVESKKYEINEKDFLINLIDSPGHVDFSSEVTAALRVTDGALVVVDCVEGVQVQTETVLRQAINERIKPVLFVNKLDRVLLELKMGAEESYQSFNKAIESANVVIETYHDKLLGEVQVKPTNGTVGFGSGLHGWGFTLATFASIYASKFGMDKHKMMNKMWGENFIDPKRNVWSTKPVDNAGNQIPRGFVHFILKPIFTMFETVLSDQKDKYTALLEKLNIKLPADCVDLTGKPLIKRIMQTWLPAGDALLQMIVVHLPSPAQAQKYRIANLYNGPMDDVVSKSIRACNSDGPLMMYVSKMVPTTDKGRFYAFGRVFSGTVRTNQVVHIMGPDFKKGSKVDLFVRKKIQRTVLMMGRYVELINDCPCGNVVGLVGIDQFLVKAGTLTDTLAAHPFHCMKFSVSPVVRVAVECKNSQDLPKLVEGLRRLSKSDPLVQIITTNTGEHIVAGAGELHLEICLKDLADDFMKGAPIKMSEPVVAFCETVTKESEMQCISKSANKHNRLYCTAEPLQEELCAKVDSGEIQSDTKDLKKRAKILVEEFGWQKTDAMKIWSFGCPPEGIPNILVDTTKGAAFLNEIKDHVAAGFIQITAGGVFAEEPWRGIRVNLQDVVLHADSIHRGAGQLQPCAKKVYSACQMKSGPRLMEPMYLVDISVPQDKASGCFSTLQTRRGRIVPQEEDQIGPLVHIKAFLPVLESFGFTQKLRQATSGKAFPQMIFDHWEVVEAEKGDPFDPKSKTHEIVLAVRKRKGLKVELPDFNDYYDKI